MAAHQALLSLGFSRQEHWSGLPFPSPMHESEKWKGSRSVMSDPQRPHGLQPTRLLHPWDSPGRSTVVGATQNTAGHTGSHLWVDVEQSCSQFSVVFSAASSSCVPMDHSPPDSPSMEFFKQEHWSGLAFPTPGDLPEPGTEPVSLASPALSGGFFPIVPLGSPDIEQRPFKTIDDSMGRDIPTPSPQPWNHCQFYATWGLDILLKILSAVEWVPLTTLGILSPSLKAILIVLLRISSSSELR